MPTNFIPLGVSKETTFWECAECHAVVLDGGQAGHLEWHEAQAA